MLSTPSIRTLSSHMLDNHWIKRQQHNWRSRRINLKVLLRNSRWVRWSNSHHLLKSRSLPRSNSTKSWGRQRITLCLIVVNSTKDGSKRRNRNNASEFVHKVPRSNSKIGINSRNSWTICIEKDWLSNKNVELKDNRSTRSAIHSKLWIIVSMKQQSKSCLIACSKSTKFVTMRVFLSKEDTC